MDERRESYRFSLPASGLVPVKFRTAGEQTFSGEIINLSVSGFCVLLDVPSEVAEQAFSATFILPPDPELLVIPVKMVHARGDKQRNCGYQFLFDAKNARRETLERMILQFIFKEQAQLRREARRLRRSSARINV